MLVDPPSTYAQTRDALHAVAEQLLAAARYRATGRIGLRPTPGGFGTPPYGDGEVLRVDGCELVHARGGQERRAPLTTLTAASAFAGVPLGAPPVYEAATSLDPDAPLPLDPRAALTLARWYAFATGILEEIHKSYPQASALTLWPEHFDLAITIGGATLGASPGDNWIAEPYLYASPGDDRHRTGAYAAYPWGAAMTYTDLARAGDARPAGAEFLGTGAAALTG